LQKYIYLQGFNMSTTQRFTCLRCQIRSFTRPSRRYHASSRLQFNTSLPSIAPKQSIDIKHIRTNPSVYEKSCLERNYKQQSTYPAKIINLTSQWHEYQHEARALRERNNVIKAELKKPLSTSSPEERAKLIEEARELKEKISGIEVKEVELTNEINTLAASIPNLTSAETPRGSEPTQIGTINPAPSNTPTSPSTSHVQIGTELHLLDFSSASTTSGWGWYYLLNGAALLEQALIQYSISVALSQGWEIVSPPTMVYSHIASACGFQPRDQSGEQQIYSIAQTAPDSASAKPSHSLVGTAEIPLAAMYASSTIPEASLPLRKIAVSRCYRAEAGARGIDTKGLYRVHEFTKVEMFAWTSADYESALSTFNSMLSIQQEILQTLGLHCRILEMPSTDLGASAMRKIDIEAYFPSRKERDEGWGEVTSLSICGDYQSRRLATRVENPRNGGKMAFPWTVNGTALAVPRVIAAILENGWNEERKEVAVPECLWPWMMGRKVLKKEK
jgi:seryl-tRNA synthetase